MTYDEESNLIVAAKPWDSGKRRQILSCTTEAADHQVSKECYTYDEAGNRTSYERWNGHSKVEYIRYEYNSSNQLKAMYEQEGWDWFGVEKTLYTYDADGNLVKEEIECRKYHDKDWDDNWDDDDNHDGWFDGWFDDWFGGFHGLSVVAEAEEATEQVSENNGTSISEFGFGNTDHGKDHDDDHDRPGYDTTYTTTTYAYDTENRLKAVREQGVLLQAMTYDGDGNLAYELDYNVDAVVDGRCIYFPTHGTKAERELYKKVCDGYGWVRGDYTLTEYLNDVTRENVEVLAEYGRNYCSVTVYTYGNERIAATTFNGYGYHFGCHDHGYNNIFTQYEKWHDRWQIKDRWHNNHHGNRPRTAEVSYNSNTDKFKATYGSHSSYHSGKYCGHEWKTAMSKIYYLYDGHGSVERVHGKDGSTFRLEYDTYGNLVAGIVEKWHVWYNDIFAHRTANIYAYSGERYNVISGLQFLRARWYDTDTGRFISEDSYLGTQENPLSRNRYIYTANNPVNYVDPSGHKAVEQTGESTNKRTVGYRKNQNVSAGIAVVNTEKNALKEAIRKVEELQPENSCGEVGDFLPKAWNGVKTWAKNFFGAESSTTITIAEIETPVIPDPSPITIKTGTKITQTVSKHGDSSKPISVYANKDVQHPIKSSSAGIKINIVDFTLDLSVGLDDIGISGSLANGNKTDSFGIKLNLSELKVGVEFSTAIEKDNITDTAYTNVSVGGWGLAVALILASVGQHVQLPSYAY